MRKLLTVLCLFMALAADAIVPPYSNNLMSSAGFQMIDANKDGKTFKFRQEYDQETLELYGFAQNDSPAGGCDDWLVLPSIILEAGKYYEFSADIRAWSAKWNETFELYVGTKATVAGMTTKLMDATTICHTDYRRYTAGFMPSRKGAYYFAIRHCNASEGFSLRVLNVFVDIAASVSAPDAPVDLVVTPDWGGALKADVSFTAPAKNLDGSDLEALTKANIFRDGELVGTLDNIEPGKAYVYTDQGMSEDYHEYAVSVSNDAGESPKATARRFCGVPLPAPPASCRIVETSTPGEVTMTWEPVTKDVDGYDLNPALLSYVVVMVENGNMVIRGKELTGTSFTFNALPQGEEISVAYGGVYAYTRDYSATAPGSNTMVIGKSYDLPYAESYKDAKPTYMFAAARTAGHGGEWNLFTDKTATDVQSQDGDNGFAACKIEYKQSASKLMLGKFNLTNEETELRFWYYPYVAEGEAANTVDVLVTDAENNLHTVASVQQVGTLGEWREAVIDLSEFKGQTVRIELNVTCVSRQYTLLDNIKIGNVEDGITDIVPKDLPTAVFNLQGVRLTAPQRGLNIINGKKIVK